MSVKINCRCLVRFASMLLVAFVLSVSGVFAVGTASAEMVVQNNKILLGEDYSVFPNDTGSPGLCRRKCVKDRRCQAWTYVRPVGGHGVGECRLKRDVVAGFKNSCCISGKKQEDYRSDGNRKPKNARAHRRRVEFCDEWASSSVKLNERNVENRCGYRGRAWHSNVDRHFRRCMRLGPKARLTERKGQKQAVNSCIEELSFGKRARCEHYAKTAVVQNSSRIKTACGKGDVGEWGAKYKSHYSWCLGAKKGVVQKQQKAREQQLQQCFAFEGRRSGPCHDYATSAIEHFRKNIAKGCDLHGPRWHNNYRRHVGWCRQVSPRDRYREIKKRRLTLKTCRLFGKIGIKWR